MAFRTKSTVTGPNGKTYSTRPHYGRPAPRPRPSRQVAGPYRSQSSVRSIRAQATRREHRAAPPSPRPNPLAVPSTASIRHSLLATVRAKARHRRARASAEHAERRAIEKLRRATSRGLTAGGRVLVPTPRQRLLRDLAIPKAKLPGPEGVLAKENRPPAELKKIAPEVYAKAIRAARRPRASTGGLKEDPLAELAISTLATAGVGAGARLAGTAAKSALAARTGSEIASTGATVGEKAAETGLRAALKRATTSEGRRSLAAREAARLEKAGTRVRRHPLRSTAGGYAAVPGEPTDLSRRVKGAAKGAREAVTHHPVETLQTTARALPAAITGPAALLEAAGLSAIHGDSRYLSKTASEQAKGIGQIVGDTFSGDPKRAERAFRKEGAGALFTPLPAVTRLGKYAKARDALREAANAGRRTAASRSEWANRNLRHAPRGSAPPVFGFAARRAERKRAALKHQRAYNPPRVSQGHHERALANAISKAPEGSHVALQTVAEYGVRDRRGAEWLRRHGPGDRQLVKALDYMDAHPEMWRSKAFSAAIKAHERSVEALPAAVVGKGERARLLPQGDALGIARPGMRVPHARRDALSGAKTWQDVVARVDRLKKGHADNLRLAKRRLKIARSGVAQALKSRDRTRARRLDNPTPRNRDAATRADAVYRMAKRRRDQAVQELKTVVADGRQLQQLRKEAVARARPTLKNEAAYNSDLLHEYAQEVEQGRAAAGLERSIYTPHSAGEKGAGLENRFPTPVGRKEHMRRGGYALENNLDRSLEGLVRGTRAARERAGGKQFGRDLGEERLPFQIDGETRYIVRDHKEWEQITGRKSAENPNGGQYDPKSVGRLAIRELKNAIDDPFATDAQRSAALDAILRDAEEGRTKDSAPSLLLPRELIREARAQIHPEHNPVTKTFNVGARVANRAILGTNPAWAIAQVPAEGIPLLMANPELLVKGPALTRGILRYRREHPEDAAMMEAAAGAAPRSAAAAYTPLDQASTELFARSGKALTRGKTARVVLDFVNLRALGGADRGRQNAFRTVLYAAEADKRFRSWHAAVRGLFDSQARLAWKFRKLPREELWKWLDRTKEGRIEKRRLEDYVDNIQGNWTAFTRYERAWAPFTIFYPFLRYSLRWSLWTFPRTHPIVATMAYMLGQANSNQLEKLAGGKLGNPLEYAFPVYSGPKGKAVLPGGSRISPGQSALTQALAAGNPAQVLSSANPFAAAGVTALTGIEPLSGEKSSQPRGIAALNQLLAMPAPLRLAGFKLGGRSALGSAFAGFDSGKKLRSGLLPMLPESAARFRASEQLGRRVKEKYELPSIPSVDSTKVGQEVLHGGPGGTPQPQLLKRAIKELHRQERASDFVTKVEQPFFGPEKNSPKIEAIRTALREALEDAWQTGPHGGGSNPWAPYSSTRNPWAPGKATANPWAP